MSLLWPILSNAFLRPRKVAVIDDQREYTFLRLSAGSMYVADKVDATTDNPHVGILLPTSGAFPVAMLGCWLARRTIVPLNFLLNPAELHHVIEDSGIDTIITVGPLLDFMGRDKLPAGLKMILLEKLDFGGLPPFRWPPRLADDALAALLYTSGTSGKPKGVMLSHGNFEANVRDAIRHANFMVDGRMFGVLPQFHSFGFTALTLVPLFLGMTVIYSARFVPKKIVDLIRKHKPDVMMAVPSMYGALLTVKGAGPEDFASLKYGVSGGEPLPDATMQAARDRLGLKILEGFGLTETAPVTHWSTPDAYKHKSVGRPLATVHQIIVDDQDRIQPPDTDGEILLAGPNIMQGYYKLPQETAKVFVELDHPMPDGSVVRRKFFRTGDIGRIDHDGFLYITGRKKEMLIIAGENVFPREIEEVLNKHESIKDSAIIGKSDDLRGEVPVAFVELNEGCELDVPGLHSHCRQSLAPFKIPKDIRAVDQLPRSPTGKILRRHLKAD